VNSYFGRNAGTRSVASKKKASTEASSPNRFERKESEWFKSVTYEELTKGDKLNLDIFWLKDESLEDSANLPHPDIWKPR
jgi:hypothetical protein